MILSEEFIQSELGNAIKSRDQIRIAACRSIKTEMLKEQTKPNGKKVLGHVDIINVIERLIGQREESYECFKSAGRETSAQAELEEMIQLKTFLPEPLTDDEAENALKNIAKEKGYSGLRCLGNLIKDGKIELAGKVPPKRVSELAKSVLLND